MFQFRYLINVSIEISHKHHMRLLRNIYEISQRFRFLPGIALCIYVLKSHLKYSKTAKESFILAVNYIKIQKNANISQTSIEITP